MLKRPELVGLDRAPERFLERLAGKLDLGFLVVGLLSILIIYPLAQPGLPATTDGHLHLHRVVELDQVWRGGLYYPAGLLIPSMVTGHLSSTMQPRCSSIWCRFCTYGGWISRLR